MDFLPQFGYVPVANHSTIFVHTALGDPYNVTATLTKDLSNNRYDVMVGWEFPDWSREVVQYFEVKLNELRKNVSADESRLADFYDVPLDVNCLVGVRAFSRAGKGSNETLSMFSVTRDAKDRRQDLTYYYYYYYYYAWTTALVVAFAFCAVALIVGGRHERRRASAAAAATDFDKMVAAGGHDAELLKILRDDVHLWLGAEDVTVFDVFLGRGHFGVVRKGTLRTNGDGGGEYTVAVKSLRDRPSGRDLEQFLGEILLMQKVGKHPNIVSMIGCCMDADKRCMLVVEYCPLGDLQTFLKKVRALWRRLPPSAVSQIINIFRVAFMPGLLTPGICVGE